MVLHFRIEDTILDEIYAQLLTDDLDGDGTFDSNHQEAEVALTGETLEAQLFEGSDQLNLFLSGKQLRAMLEDLAAAGMLT